MLSAGWFRYRLLLATLILGWVAGWLSHDLLKTDTVAEASLADVFTTNTHGAVEGAEVDSASTEAKGSNRVDLAALPSSPNALQLFNQLLYKNQFSTAIDKHWPQQHSAEARASIFTLAESLQRKESFKLAESLLRAYRKHFTDDIVAGLLHAELLHQRSHLEQEAFLLVALLQQTLDPNLILQINNQLNNAIKQRKDGLINNGEYGQLLKFYRKLSNTDGSNPNYQWVIAKTLTEMGQLEQATTILQPLTFDFEVKIKAKKLLQRIKYISSAQYQSTIPLQRIGEHFLVSIAINGGKATKLLLDTGASITLVSQAQFSPPEGSVQKEITVLTANGRMNIAITPSNRVSIGSFEVDDVTVGLIEQPISTQANGLLGMNVLKHFDFYIDQNIPALKLSLR